MKRRIPDLLLSDAVLLADVVVELAALHVLEDEDDAVLLLEDLVDVNDVGVVEADEHLDLVLGGEEVGLVELGREHLAAVLAHCPLHGAARPVCLLPHVRPIISYNS